jgi:hypothetical protein
MSALMTKLSRIIDSDEWKFQVFKRMLQTLSAAQQKKKEQQFYEEA